MSVSLPTSNLFAEASNPVIEAMNQHPAIATAAIMGGCAVIGAVLEYREVSKIKNNREQLVDEWQVLTENIEPKRSHRAVKAVTSLAFVGGGLIGFANAEQWIDSNKPEVVPPTVQLVVDKSGSSLLNNQTTAITIGNLTSSFSDKLVDFDTTAWVASSGTVDQMSLKDAQNFQPFGDAPLDRAFGLSIDSAVQKRTTLLPGQEVPSTAIAVITNGNTISGSTTEDEVKFAGSPIYIFDVSEDKSGSVALKELAKNTGGEYYAKDSFDTVEEINNKIEYIAERVSATEKKGKESTDWNGRILASGLSILAFTAWKSRRSKEPTRFNIPDGQPLRTKFKNNTVGRLPFIGKKVRS